MVAANATRDRKCDRSTVKPGRWILSVLITLHAVALLIASLPNSRDLASIDQSRAAQANASATALQSMLDRGADSLLSIEPRLVRSSARLRMLALPYISLGLRQKWNMFSNPMTVDQYVRVDQYVVSHGPGRSPRVFSELALPAQRDDRVRLVHEFRDKAVLNALETFFVNRVQNNGTGPPPTDLEPVARYFRNSFRGEYLQPDERVVRTDVWFGEVSIEPPRHRLTPQQRASRLATISKYWYGPIEVPRTSVPKHGAMQREDSILWRLEYDEEP